MGLSYLSVEALAFSPEYATDHTLFAGTVKDAVYKSTDSGVSWSLVTVGIDFLNVSALALSPGYATDQTLFAGTDSGVFKSADGGASWSAMNAGLGNLSIGSLALTSTSPRILFAGTMGSSVWQYTLLPPTPTPTPTLTATPTHTPTPTPTCTPTLTPTVPSYRLWLPVVLRDHSSR